MKILFYQDLPSIESTLLTWTLCEELRLLGHYVDYYKPTIENYNGIKYDWVHGSGADSCWPALNFAREIGAKCHIHLEGVAPWRVGIDTARKHGYEAELPEEEIKKWKDYYGGWMITAFDADSCSVNGMFQQETIRASLFDGKPLPNCHLISCGVDARYVSTLPGSDPQGYMITISRLENNKKVFMIADALVILKKRGLCIPPWMVIGYGSHEQVERLVDFCLGNKIVFDLRTYCGASKWFWIKHANIMLQGLSGIPPAEGLLCDVPVLGIASPSVIELFGDAIYTVENNDTEGYADKIEWLLKNPQEASKKTAYGKTKLLNGEIFACTQQQLVEKYEAIFSGKKI